jgi:hypothetical protein
MPLGADHPLLGQEYNGSIVKGLKEKKDKPTPDGKIRYYLEVHTVDGNVHKEYDWIQYEPPPKGKASDGLDEVIVVSPQNPKRDTATVPRRQNSANGPPVHRPPNKEGKMTSNGPITPEKNPKKKIVVKGFMKGEQHTRKTKHTNVNGIKKQPQQQQNQQSDAPPLVGFLFSPLSDPRKLKTPEQAPSRNVSMGDSKPMLRKTNPPLTSMEQVMEENEQENANDLTSQARQEKEKEALRRKAAVEETKRRIEEDAALLKANRQAEAERESKRKMAEKLRKSEEKKCQEAEAERRRKEEEEAQNQREAEAAMAEEEARRRAQQDDTNKQRKNAVELKARCHAVEEETGIRREDEEIALAREDEGKRRQKDEDKETTQLRESDTEQVKFEAVAQVQAERFNLAYLQILLQH